MGLFGSGNYTLGLSIAALQRPDKAEDKSRLGWANYHSQSFRHPRSGMQDYGSNLYTILYLYYSLYLDRGSDRPARPEPLVLKP